MGPRAIRLLVVVGAVLSALNFVPDIGARHGNRDEAESPWSRVHAPRPLSVCGERPNKFCIRAPRASATSARRAARDGEGRGVQAGSCDVHGSENWEILILC